MRTTSSPTRPSPTRSPTSAPRAWSTIGALGNFTMLGMCLNAFQVDFQADKGPPFPDVRGYAKVRPQATP